MSHTEYLVLEAKLQAINAQIKALRAETNKRTTALRKLQNTRVSNKSMFRREMLESIIRA